MIEPSQIAADNEGFVDITGTYVQQSMLPGATTPFTSSFGNDGFVDKIRFPLPTTIDPAVSAPIAQMGGTDADARTTVAGEGGGNSGARNLTAVDQLFAAGTRGNLNADTVAIASADCTLHVPARVESTSDSVSGVRSVLLTAGDQHRTGIARQGVVLGKAEGGPPCEKQDCQIQSRKIPSARTR